MKPLSLPAFGETNFTENRENRHARVLTFEGAEASAFDAYCALLASEGYAQKEAYAHDSHRFAAFHGESRGVFLNFFGATHELRIVVEENCAYFSQADHPAAAHVPAQITQIALEDFGMSYVIRLSDGRFIVIDGGRNLEPDCDNLFACLRADSPFEKPVIAAWILSHPHSDHFHCFLGFMEKYAQEIEIESFLYNFPEHDDFGHYPNLQVKESQTDDLSGFTHIPRMQAWIDQTGAAVYTPHTGQRYTIGDAQMDILASMDDTLHLSQNINAASLVIRMALGGQTILWATDAGFSYARLPERYGHQLRADILQIPHHGFQSGEAGAELAGFALIQPRVCLLPASDYVAYTFFCAFRPGARSLMLSDSVEEIITGSVQRTLTLPYAPPANAREASMRLFRQGQENAGARTWIFTGLSTAREDDFVFTLLNTVIPPAKVQIDLYFEEKDLAVRQIQTELGGSCIKRLNIVGDEVDGDALFFNGASLKRRGIPQNQPFAVRFLSDIPIVVAHRDHAAVYHSAT